MRGGRLFLAAETAAATAAAAAAEAALARLAGLREVDVDGAAADLLQKNGAVFE